jgi:alkylated DNA repair protein alkB family protein 6
MYTDTLHGIDEVMVDEVGEGTIANWDLLGEKEKYEVKEGARYERENRLSLTYRDVLKVAKVGGAMKFLGKR